MKNIAIPILVAIIFIVMAVYLVTFQVRETESGFVTRFGKHTREITEPGLYLKWPTPIEQVHKFDSRMRVLEAAELAETTTRGNVPIIVNTYVVWRVAQPLKFLNAVKTEENAESKLRNHINDAQNRIIGQHSFGEFVNSDPAKVQFEKIQEDMLADLKGPVLADYGIEIKSLGIKQIKVSADVTKQVFERMKAERQGRTDAITSQGEAMATQIRVGANEKRAVLLDAAQARAKEIQGQGDADAAKYYEMLEVDPKLAMFLRNLESLKTTLRERSTFLVPMDAEPFSLLMGMPSLGTEKTTK